MGKGLLLIQLVKDVINLILLQKPSIKLGSNDITASALMRTVKRDNSITHNPNFNDPEQEPRRKHCGKRLTCWLPEFTPFHTMFSTL